MVSFRFEFLLTEHQIPSCDSRGPSFVSSPVPFPHGAFESLLTGRRRHRHLSGLHSYFRMNYPQRAWRPALAGERPVRGLCLKSWHVRESPRQIPRYTPMGRGASVLCSKGGGRLPEEELQGRLG